MKVRQWCLFFAGVFLLLLLRGSEAGAIPADDLLRSLIPTADVNDFANLLTAEETVNLESRCRQLRERTGAQLAVVTLQSLEGGEIEDFTNKLFAQWGVGQKEEKNGIMLLVSMQERKSRIEVGYGLEPIIPDILAGRILDHELTPEFRQGNYADGLTAAVNEICDLVERGTPADLAALAREPEASLSQRLMLVLFLSLFVAIGGFLCGTGLHAKQAAAVMPGVLFAALPMLMGFSAAGPFSLAIHVPVAIAFAVLGWSQAKHFKRQAPGRYRRSAPRPVDWNWGGSTGPAGGWHSGSGGFSQGWGGFGGGSSGGGGATGSW